MNRELRQGNFNTGFQFIYTGSIGLGNVVNKLGRTDLINDIVNVSLPPLTRAEARKLIQRLVSGLKTKGCDLDLDEKTIHYILDKDSWRIPYYIQIIVEELQDHCQETCVRIDEGILDEVINKIITDRYKYQDYFENWKTRLKQAFEGDEYRCAVQVLNHISTHGQINYNDLYNLSVAHKIRDLKDITNVLEYDGYISRNKEKIYRFNSIILKEWWYVNVAE
ncbi:MAG: hypothetical protein KKC20_02905 [Proteobacteria bacterium]|nr:hypothetical protein [Pseudomonadota bacterium]